MRPTRQPNLFSRAVPVQGVSGKGLDAFVHAARAARKVEDARTGWADDAFNRVRQGLSLAPQALACGSYACVYPLLYAPAWVLKITSDMSEAAALETIRKSGGAPAESAIPRLGRVFAIPTLTGGYAFGAFVQKLFPLGRDERAALDDHQLEIRRVPKSASHEERVLAELVRDYRGRYTGGWLGRGFAEHTFKLNAARLLRTVDALFRLGVEIHDLNGSNVLQTGAGIWKISDFGVATAPLVDVPLIDSLDLSAEARRLVREETR